MADFRVDFKKVSKRQFRVTFHDHDLMIDNAGKGLFDLNGDALGSSKVYKFTRFEKVSRALAFSTSYGFQFTIRYQPFVLNDKPTVDELISRGVAVEYSPSVATCSHYLIKNDMTLSNASKLSQESPHIALITRQFVDEITMEDEFKWPQQAPTTVYTSEEKSFPAGAIELKPYDGSEGLLWGAPPSDYNGLTVSDDTKLYDILSGEAGERPRKRRKRAAAISNLQTMIDYPMEDFEVIRTEESETHPVESEPEEGDSVHVSKENPTTFTKVYVSDNEEDNEPVANAEDNLVKAFQTVKRVNRENEAADEELIKAETVAKVTKFKVTSVSNRARTFVSRGLSNPDWVNRKDYSKFHKTVLPQGNPVTDSTVKGIPMKSFRPDTAGRLTEAEKALLRFNDGIDEMDSEFDTTSKKRAASTRRQPPARRQAPSRRQRSALFVSSDEDEPSFKRNQPVSSDDEPDEMPRFRRRHV